MFTNSSVGYGAAAAASGANGGGGGGGGGGGEAAAARWQPQRRPPAKLFVGGILGYAATESAPSALRRFGPVREVFLAAAQ